MKNLFWMGLAVLVATTATSCKVGGQNTPDQGNKTIGGLTQPTARNFTNSEMQIGRRICSSLKTKRTFFDSLTNEKEQFRFRGQIFNCNNAPQTNILFPAKISNATSDLEYISTVPLTNYFKDVVTDQSSVIKQMCDSLNGSDSVANTSLNGNFQYAVNFLIADGFDRYDIIKSQKDLQGKYNILSGESVSIFSQNSQAGAKFIGVEKERDLYTVCDSTHYQTMSQTWVEAITSF